MISTSGLSLEIQYYLKTNKTIQNKHTQQNYNLKYFSTVSNKRILTFGFYKHKIVENIQPAVIFPSLPIHHLEKSVLFSALFEFIPKTGCLCQFLLVVFTAVSQCNFTVQLATLQNLFLFM